MSVRSEVENNMVGFRLGCPVCGYGVDWRWYPEFVCLSTPSLLVSFVLGLMLWEYLCVRCLTWAKAVGAEWDGKINFNLEPKMFSGLRAEAVQCSGEFEDVVTSKYCPGNVDLKDTL